MSMTRKRTKVEEGIRKVEGPRGTVYEARASDHNGNQTARTFPTLRDARAWRRKTLGQVERGRRLDIVVPTLREYADQYLERIRNGDIRRPGGKQYTPNTAGSYESSLRIHIYPDLGGARLDRITYSRIQDIANTMQRAGLSGNTIRNAMTALASVLAHARTDGIIDDNPCRGVRAPSRAKRGAESAISMEEAAKLIALMRDARFRTAWGLMFYGGMRLGEALAIDKSRINIVARTITVDRSRYPDGTYGPTKSGKSRTVPICAELLALLGTAPTDPVVPTCHRSWFEHRSRQWGMAVTPHEARHTCATAMIEAGIDYKVVSEVMGHASITTTLDVYGHVRPHQLDDVREKMDAFLGVGSRRGNAG